MSGDGPLVIALMILIRIAIPILVTLALAYIYERISARWETGDVATKAPGDQSPQSAVLSLAETDCEACPIWERVLHAAEQRPGIPCWLALQLAEGHLHEECLSCQVFKEGFTQRSRPA